LPPCHQHRRVSLLGSIAVLVRYFAPAVYRDAMATRPRLRTTATAMVALASVIWALGGGQAGAATRAPLPASSSSWTAYDDSGATGSMAAVNTTTPAWTSPALDGELYGQ